MRRKDETVAAIIQLEWSMRGHAKDDINKNIYQGFPLCAPLCAPLQANLRQSRLYLLYTKKCRYGGPASGTLGECKELGASGSSIERKKHMVT